MTRDQKTRRRIVLGSLLTGISTTLAGCAAVSDGGDGSASDSGGDAIQNIDVDGFSLVVELDRDAIAQLNVIDPSGELLVQRMIESGVSRTTFPLPIDYPPGEYELIRLADGETIETTSVLLEPELELTELRLGRDHPEEMYDSASDYRTEAEAILSVTNSGTGPTAVTALRFEGDVPLPTHESYDETGSSGIYDPENDFGADAESITIPAGETVLVYSNTRPFLPINARSKCESIGRDGQLIVHLSATHDEANLTTDRTIHYITSDSDDCHIEIKGSL